MNKTFKVVFNKVRGTLTVVNECTKSVQAKGTKTVVALAVLELLPLFLRARTPMTQNGRSTPKSE